MTRKKITKMDTNTFLTELSKLRPSSTFLTLHGYSNDAGEIADYSIAFHMSYKTALERSIAKLTEMKLNSDLEKLAREELLTSFRKSLNQSDNPDLEVGDAYTSFYDEDGKPIKGVKMHIASGALHLYGLVVHKLIKMPGTYPKVNSRPLTIAKNKLRYLTPVGKFRQFKITSNQVDRIVVNGLSLLPPQD